jgi:hypothetical protein
VGAHRSVRVQTSGFAVGCKELAESINSYLIERLTQTGHLLGRPEISSRQISFSACARETTKIGRGAEQKVEHLLRLTVPELHAPH